jgi:hypothetical protein
MRLRIIGFFLAFQIFLPAQSYLGYNFINWQMYNYTPLTDYVVSTAKGDDGSEVISLPFTFNYMGVNYSTIRISVNGWIEPGNSYTGSGYQNSLASTTIKPLICPLWDDLADDTQSEIRYKILGGSPARVLAVEWVNVRHNSNSLSSRKTFQVRIHEFDGVIEFIYGPEDIGFGPSRYSASIGMNDTTGGSNHFISVTPSDYYFINISTTIANDTISTFNYLEPGRVYCFVPTGNTMKAAAFQFTENIVQGSVKQPVISVVVSMYSMALTTPGVSSINFNTNGTTNPADIKNAKLYTTWTSHEFDTAHQVGTVVINPSGNFTISGTAPLHNIGSTFFWLTYDIAPNAQPGNFIDAECTNINFTLTFPLTPEITAPPGKRMVVSAESLSGVYTVGPQGDFPSLTSVNDSLKLSYISSPVTLKLMDNYNSDVETFPLLFTHVTGSSNGITIIPASDTGNIIISGNAEAIVKLDSSSNIYFKGDSSRQSLSIINNSLNAPVVSISGHSKNLKFEGCKILGADTSAAGGVILSPFLSTGSDSIVFENCLIGNSPAGNHYFV